METRMFLCFRVKFTSKHVFMYFLHFSASFYRYYIIMVKGVFYDDVSMM